MSVRVERVRELLKREIGEIIRRQLPVDEAGMITVNDVTVTGDLQHATVYFSILGGADQQKRGEALLQERRKLIQNLLGQSVVLKYTPHLKFVRDDSIARGDRVLRILDELEKQTPAGDRETPPQDS
ncbi:30S ribosome-binding factor RbfA [Fontisphaera persica]|uniref:30S ribosome-binding factor RbfA n=1 Tax=Fontisphaera persica TaxID=2974023 RepID=UPI0024C031B6|nr:30S ribosome-binding factor RbfA [Fontisphaera persica]WCJ58743.1 30S ribosome-binding factor RbfA [Fontisphaera persica]